MLKVGITGGIGAGKTTVCRLLESWGVPVYYADLRARKLMQEDRQLREEIQLLFGTTVYQNQELDRKRLAELVFGNASKLEALNGLVHPAVRRDFERWTKEQDAPYVVKEAAILFETGGDKELDLVVLVLASEEVRLQRVMERDQSTADQVRSRMKRQWTDDKKVQLADVVLRNEERQDLEQQVRDLHESLMQK